jgi:hypothetical protein
MFLLPFPFHQAKLDKSNEHVTATRAPGQDPPIAPAAGLAAEPASGPILSGPMPESVKPAALQSPGRRAVLQRRWRRRWRRRAPSRGPY